MSMQMAAGILHEVLSPFSSLQSPWGQVGLDWAGLGYLRKKVEHDRFHTCFHAKTISSLGEKIPNEYIAFILYRLFYDNKRH